MKRPLLGTLAVALVLAGCGSGGSTSTVVTKPKPAVHHRRPKPRRVVAHRRVRRHRRVVHHPKRTVTTTTAVTTTAATTTYTPTTTYTQASTTTTTVAPTPTQQTTTHTHTQHTNTCTSSHGCGYCLSVTARIGTPDGSVPVADVRPGMLVWSANLRGQRISEKVLKIRRAHVPADHPMARLRLADGRELLVSLSHPLPSGQPVEMLAAGQRFEGTRVVSAARVRYGRPYTYDLLPAGPTHTYFADGVLMGSTLAPAGAVISRPF